MITEAIHPILGHGPAQLTISSRFFFGEHHDFGTKIGKSENLEQIYFVRPSKKFFLAGPLTSVRNSAYSDIFFFRPFLFIKGSHSVSYFSKPSCFQCPYILHQLAPYLFSLHLLIEIFSLASLFFSFPVPPFSSPFFLRNSGRSS